jgi:CheY-like chemotaxis protein
MRRPRILILEDNANISGYVAILLGGLHGLNVTCAESLAKARSIFRSFRPDRLVVDMGLPDGSGSEFIREAKRVHPGIRVVVTSGRSDEGTRQEAAEAGADAYLVKPVPSDEIVEALKIPEFHEIWDDETTAGSAAGGCGDGGSVDAGGGASPRAVAGGDADERGRQGLIHGRLQRADHDE